MMPNRLHDVLLSDAQEAAAKQAAGDAKDIIESQQNMDLAGACSVLNDCEGIILRNAALDDVEDEGLAGDCVSSTAESFVGGHM